MSVLFFPGLILVGVLIWLGNKQLKRIRRNTLFVKSLPDKWIDILEKNVYLYSLLPENLKRELHGRINIFLTEKEFIACDDLTITDEIRITVAGNACILLLTRDKRCFPGFTSILMYPDTYVSKQIVSDGVVEAHEESVRAGESWYRGPIVLSWADVMRGTVNGDDGHNVVLHEFAHKLDEESNIMNGLPVLRDPSHYKEWAETLSKEYDAFLNRVEDGKNSVIDSYGAVSPVEFFAVATESFFEKPLQMEKKLPDLYQQFKQFYNLDPASWRRANN